MICIFLLTLEHRYINILGMALQAPLRAAQRPLESNLKEDTHYGNEEKSSRKKSSQEKKEIMDRGAMSPHIKGNSFNGVFG